MPTYDYLCQACSHRFETWQKMTDEPLSICPECGGHIRRVLYPTGVIFKGSGFYKTDHSKNPTLPPSNGDSSKTESTKSDTKAAESTSSENGASPAKTTTPGENKTARAAAS
jgi:putative FmdB family regulatory protein